MRAPTILRIVELVMLGGLNPVVDSLLAKAALLYLGQYNYEQISGTNTNENIVRATAHRHQSIWRCGCTIYPRRPENRTRSHSQAQRFYTLGRSIAQGHCTVVDECSSSSHINLGSGSLEPGARSRGNLRNVN